MCCVFLSNQQRSMTTLEASLTEVFSFALRSILKYLPLMFTKIYLTSVIVLRCYKKCWNFGWYFDGNSTVIICSCASTSGRMIIYTGNQTFPTAIMSVLRIKLYMQHLWSLFCFLLTILTINTLTAFPFIRVGFQKQRRTISQSD